MFPVKLTPDPQALQDLQKRVEALRGRKTGAWYVSCNFFLARPFKTQSTTSQRAELSHIGKELYVFNFDNSKKSYLLVKESVLEIDREIQSILDKTKLYTLKIPIDIKVCLELLAKHTLSISLIFTIESFCIKLPTPVFVPSSATLTKMSDCRDFTMTWVILLLVLGQYS